MNTGIITTIAGGGAPNYSGDGGPAISAQIGYGHGGLAMDQNGTLYFAENGHQVIRKIDENGIITTIAGDGTNEHSGDGGLAINAKIGRPSDLFIRGKQLFFHSATSSNGGDNRTYLRKIDLNTGIITTIAGGGAPNGYSGDGGPAISAQIGYGHGGLAMDQNGTLYFAENGHQVIRKIDENGIITTIAGDGTNEHSGDGGLAINAKIGRPSDLFIRGKQLFFHSATSSNGGDNRSLSEENISDDRDLHLCNHRRQWKQGYY